MELSAGQRVGVIFRFEPGLDYLVGHARCSVGEKTLCGSLWDSITTLLAETVPNIPSFLPGTATNPKEPHPDKKARAKELVALAA